MTNNIEDIKLTRGNDLKPTFADKLKQIFPTKLGAAVFALVVLHFVSQFVFFRNEKKLCPIENSMTAAQIESKYEAKTLEVVNIPETGIVAPPLAASKAATRRNVQPETRTPATPQQQRKPAIRKKEFRETRAERLRRVERILTGV